MKELDNMKELFDNFVKVADEFIDKKKEKEEEE